MVSRLTTIVFPAQTISLHPVSFGVLEELPANLPLKPSIFALSLSEKHRTFTFPNSECFLGYLDLLTPDTPESRKKDETLTCGQYYG
jgi:hypothetical protein